MKSGVEICHDRHDGVSCVFKLETAVGITKFKSRTVQREARLSLGGVEMDKSLHARRHPSRETHVNRVASPRLGLFCMFLQDKGSFQSLWTLKGLFFPV